MTTDKEQFAVARRAASRAKPQFLRHSANGPEWTEQRDEAERMTHEEADKLASDWNDYAASKGLIAQHRATALQ